MCVKGLRDFIEFQPPLQDLNKYTCPESPRWREVSQILCRGVHKASFSDTTAQSSFLNLPSDCSRADTASVSVNVSWRRECTNTGAVLCQHDICVWVLVCEMSKIFNLLSYMTESANLGFCIDESGEHGTFTQKWLLYYQSSCFLMTDSFINCLW